MEINNSDSAAEAACENATSLTVHDQSSNFPQINHKVKENETLEIPGLAGNDSSDMLFDVPFVG
ncbi:hypothetical protein A2U01_0107402, partial [Trifolium medium]|nr:hypothetical protein [Trifolium medium]